MKNLFKALIPLLFTALFACNSVTVKEKTGPIPVAAGDTFKASDQTDPDSAGIDCLRGKAEPIIDTADYPNVKFQMKADSLTAVETLDFENGDRLILHNWGCEYYVLTFRFETSRFQADTTNLAFWFKKAGVLTTGMLSSIKCELDLKRGLMYIDSYVDCDAKNNYTNVKLNVAIDFGGTDVRSYVKLDKVERLSDKRYAVEISFAYGPL